MMPTIRPDDVVAELGPLRRYARSLTGDRSEAEDLVHDTLVRALERRASFRPGGNLRGWLLSVLHNRFIDSRRSQRAGARQAAAASALATAAVPALQEEAVRLGQVRAAFARLPEEQRAALHLVAIEGLSYQAAAEVLGIPQGTLMSRISRARAALRAMEGHVPLADSPRAAGRGHLSVVGGANDRTA